MNVVAVVAGGVFFAGIIRIGARVHRCLVRLDTLPYRAHPVALACDLFRFGRLFKTGMALHTIRPLFTWDLFVIGAAVVDFKVTSDAFQGCVYAGVKLACRHGIQRSLLTIACRHFDLAFLSIVTGQAAGIAQISCEGIARTKYTNANPAKGAPE